MAEPVDDGWKKVGEMVRNSPPPMPHERFREHIEAEKQRALQPKKRNRKTVWKLVVAGLVIAGLSFLAIVYGPKFFPAKSTDDRTDDNKAGIVKPVLEKESSVKAEFFPAKSTDDRTDDDKAGIVKPMQEKESSVKGIISSEGKTVSIRKGVKAVNVRPTPSVDKPPVAKLTGDDNVEMLRESGLWVRIRYKVGQKQGEGWIRKDLIAN